MSRRSFAVIRVSLPAPAGRAGRVDFTPARPPTDEAGGALDPSDEPAGALVCALLDALTAVQIGGVGMRTTRRYGAPSR